MSYNLECTWLLSRTYSKHLVTSWSYLCLTYKIFQYNPISRKNVFFLVIYCFEKLVESEFVKEECGDSVEGMKSLNDYHEDEPEPHSKIHLLIDDILQKWSV